MSYEQELQQHLKNSKRLDTVGQYSLYYNKEKHVLGIYNGRDLYETTLKQLGDLIFNDNQKDVKK